MDEMEKEGEQKPFCCPFGLRRRSHSTVTHQPTDRGRVLRGMAKDPRHKTRFSIRFTAHVGLSLGSFRHSRRLSNFSLPV